MKTNMNLSNMDTYIKVDTKDEAIARCEDFILFENI